jgi:hypothetical protein
MKRKNATFKTSAGYINQCVAPSLRRERLNPGSNRRDRSQNRFEKNALGARARGALLSPVLSASPDFPPHLLSGLVLAKPHIDRVPQEVVGSPGQMGRVKS